MSKYSFIDDFLEERFLSKELSGRVVELDEVIEPSLQPVCSRAQEVVPVAPTPSEVKADDGDHRASPPKSILCSDTWILSWISWLLTICRNTGPPSLLHSS